MPAPSTRPTASPTAADSLSQDGTDEFDQTIPAGGSITVPIDFEGSTSGSLMGYARDAGQTVTFRGTSLKVEKTTALGGTYWTFGESVASPVNGDLVIRNTTGAPVEVFGFAMIFTRRHLHIEPSTFFPRKGQEIGFDISLTQATGADDVTASFVDSSGTKTPFAVTRVGTSHWTGRATFPAQGEYVIRATTTRTHLRAASTSVTVAAGNVTVSPTFDEQVDDSNRDGLIDTLVLTPTITVASAGTYRANATLVDQVGVEVGGSSEGDRTLVAGSQPLKLAFDGPMIYKSGRSGPYTLKVTVLHDITTTETIEIDNAVLGKTAAYDYMQFQHDRVAFDFKSLASKAVDTNGDGLFDEIDLTGTVTVEEPGLYEINTSVYADKPWEYVSADYRKVQLEAGPNTFELVFKGSDIAKSGRGGPYVVAGLLCYLDSAPMDALPSYVPNYFTAAYKASQFGG
jgi:hypothetical protein